MGETNNPVIQGGGHVANGPKPRNYGQTAFLTPQQIKEEDCIQHILKTSTPPFEKPFDHPD